MKLSIGMIVKNEEKYLEQCLTALKPILENVDSELIIADTGSTDRTFEIARKFTDNVFHFEWINDFAAARNSTLDKAKGEWYMYIDADEIFTDCTEIINFFNSGEYKRYHSATLNIKSYNDLTRRDFFITNNLHRLSAVEEGLRFVGSIHEQLSLYNDPTKVLNTPVDHYGYVILENGKKLDTAKEKSQRNLELLRSKLEEEKKSGEISVLLYGQISDCYTLVDEFEEALKYVDLGMENCPPQSAAKIDYYNKKLKILNRLKRFNDIIEVSKDYFSENNLARKGKLVTDSNIYFFWSAASFELGNYDDTISRAALGFDVYRDYSSGKLFTYELGVCSIETTITTLKQVFAFFISACEKTGRYTDAINVISSIDLKNFLPDLTFMKAYLGARILFMEKTNYNKLSELYYQLDKPNKKEFADLLIRNVFTTNQTEHFLKKFSLIANDNERLSDINKLFNSFFIQHNLKPSQTTEFIKKHGTKNNEAVWIMMMKRNFDIMPFIGAEDFDPVESIQNVYNDVVEADLAMDMFADQIPRLSPKGVDKAVNVFYGVVRGATKNNFDTTKVIRSFALLGKRWKALFPDKEETETVKFALEISGVSELHRKKHYSEAVDQLNALIEKETRSDENSSGEQPVENDADNQSSESDAAKILRHYIKVINIDEKRGKEMLDKHGANEVLIELSAKIKQEIRAMIEQWDLDGAEDALNRMAKMAPFDPDIEDLRDEITDRKINYMNYM